jgi:UDP-N-acetylmuramoyl-L-alanyl-D-glutamate--2,6-diaminopimelate ligase
MRPLRKFSKRLTDVADFLKVDLDPSQVNIEINGICSDSRNIQQGDLFIAIPGERHHGIEFVDQAISKGARAVISDTTGYESARRKIASISIENTQDLPVTLTDWFYDFPTKKLMLFGITGTNGKTTTTFLLSELFKYSGLKTGIIGTVAIEIAGKQSPAKKTTPTGDEIVSILARMQESSVTHVAIEVSSHALSQKRVSGLHFESVGFTNLSQDHLDYHGNMESYFQAKRTLFTDKYAKKAFINKDNDYGRRLAGEIEIAHKAFSLRDSADWNLRILKESSLRKVIQISGPGDKVIDSESTLIGEFNFENLLLAVSIAIESGLDVEEVSRSIPKLMGAPGRLQLVVDQPNHIYVDYAHTPDAVLRVLKAVRSVKAKRIIGVLGCGGDRDRTKRSAMGAALNSGCDLPIFTSDNPRSESPEKILDEMISGLKLKDGAEIIIDRRSAIRRAIEIAKPGDLIIVLGKGHETGQEILGKSEPFDDRIEIMEAIGAK